MQNMTVHKLKNVFLGAFKNYEKNQFYLLSFQELC